MSDFSVNTQLPSRIRQLIATICEGMFEREEIISIALLGALSGQNTFLYGPPGTAKSLISRRISCAFRQPQYFEYLMNRFSTPEEVFGPVSIKALKEDRYTRKTGSYLPKAEFAFLDEIWKSSPAILNTLLTLINERIFRNGEEIEQAPLKALIAASNETPDTNQGLEALYDRFIVRLMVGPIKHQDNFERLLRSKPTQAEIAVADDLAVSGEEWNAWREALHQVQLSSETLDIIALIRAELDERFDELNVYVSDRRWQRAAVLMKASAFFNGRAKTDHSDALILSYCLWTEESNRQAVADIVEQAVQQAGFDLGVDLASIDEELADIEQTAQPLVEVEESDPDSDYFTVPFDRPVEGYTLDYIYIPKDKVGSVEPFSPYKSEDGQSLDSLICIYNEDGTFSIRNRDGKRLSRTPISGFMGLVGKNIVAELNGIKQEDDDDEYELVTPVLVSPKRFNEPQQNQLMDTKRLMKDRTEKCTEFLSELKQSSANCFLSEDKQAVMLLAVEEKLSQIQLRIKECERLEDLCQ